MRSQNINFNSMGAVGCLGLLALGLVLVNPVASSVYAYDSAPGDGEETGGSSSSSSVVSSVQIAFGDPVGVAELAPVSSNGASAKYSVKATVSVENSGGYAVYLGSSKSELTGKNTGTTINPVTGSSSYEGLPLNSWGYNAVEGETAGDSFSAMPTNNRGSIIGENTSNNIKSDEKTFTLSFAARIGNDKPADTYENQVTMSVVSSPMEVVANDFGITTMQEMTSAVCDAAADTDEDGQVSAQLEDIRDGKYYWVSKLADSKCWMTQNLDLDLSTAGLSTLTSDLVSDWDASSPYPPSNTVGLSGDTANTEATGTVSWNLGTYIIIRPTATTNCGNGITTYSSCSSRFLEVGSRSPSSDPNFYANNGATFTTTEYDAHYLVGNHYQWNAATAGTGGVLTSGQASGSICPKGWKLPDGGSASGSYAYLLKAGGIESDSAALTSPPYSFVRSGYVEGANMMFGPGLYGRYWSSKPSTNRNNADHMNFYSTVLPLDSYYRYYGNSVRCIAR